MKKLLFLAVILPILASCEKFSYIQESEIFFKTESGLEYKYSDINLYDSSAYILYFKESHDEFKNVTKESFSFLNNGEIIYSGDFWPGYLNSLPDGPFIWTSPNFYGSYALKIDYFQVRKADVRNSPAMISVLKEKNLLHSGLAVTINSVDINGNTMAFTFTVTNHDQTDLLILDPYKMGSGLFHYYTTGLTIRDSNFDEVFSGKVAIVAPQPWDSWNADWFSLLKSGNSMQFTISYAITTPVNAGEYTAYFQFPGLSYQVSREQLMQGTNRIWLGDIMTTKSIRF